MTDFDLLNTVHPANGWFAIVGIKGKDVRQELVATREELDELADQFVKQKRNVFYGLAKYKTGDNRTKNNVQGLKSFWLDIDCGEGKAEVNPETNIPEGYIDQATGIQELKRFCKLIGLPQPIIVNSGRGLHVYWALTEEVTREQWEPVADRLRELCTTHKFYIDSSVFEVARILRIPGTCNFKDDPPTPVSVINTAEPVTLQEFSDLLGVKEKPFEKPARRGTALGQYLQTGGGNNITKFSKIMIRSAQGTGCKQLLDCYKNQAVLAEPRWFDALSVANKCVDRDEAIVKMSSKHPDYSFSNADAKASNAGGPHSCAVFERNNPGGCEGCPHKGKISGPIALGREVLQATAEDNIVSEIRLEDELTEAPSPKHKIPEYPQPFFRGKTGGIYYVPPGEDEAEPVLIYEHDLYVLKRMNDPQWGDVVVLKLHLPRDGVKEFVLTNVQVSEKSDLRKALASYGVICTPKKFDLLHLYIFLSIKELQVTKKAEQMRTQFGWADKDSKFIIGDREISTDGTYHSPPSSTTADLAELMVPKGSLEKWKEAFALYGRPGLEPHAFATLTGFGSLLFKFVGQNGAIINVIHPKSGTGKSTILYMVNSIMGDPKKLCASFADTMNAKIMQLGIMNNICYTVDEMTNTPPLEFSQLAYSMSQGRGKHRVKASSNELRQNHTMWQNLSLCSSNAAFYEKLASLKANPDGEMMRLLEYKIEYTDVNVISTEEAKGMFDHQLLENYGHAGPLYAEYLINNLESVVEALLAIQRKIDTELKLTQRERFWSGILACNITGGLIARRIGLIDWDMTAIYNWATSMVHELRHETEPPMQSSSAVIGDFYNRHVNNVLVVEDDIDKRNTMPKLPTMEPRGELLIRFEPDTNKMFIVASKFKKDCVETQISYKETLKELEAQGVFLGTVTKRLSKGMKIVSPGVHALVFDCSHPDFSGIAQSILPPEEETDDSRAG